MQREHPGDQVQQGVSKPVIRNSSGVKGTLALGVFLLPFGRPGRRLVHGALAFLAAALALLAAFSASLRTTCSTRRGKTPGLHTHQRQGEEGQPWHRFAIQTGKEPIQTMGALARFGDDDFVAHEEVDILGPIHLMSKEHPKERGPRYHRREKTLHRPITAPSAAHRDRPNIVTRPVMTNIARAIR